MATASLLGVVLKRGDVSGGEIEDDEAYHVLQGLGVERRRVATASLLEGVVLGREEMLVVGMMRLTFFRTATLMFSSSAFLFGLDFFSFSLICRRVLLTSALVSAVLGKTDFRVSCFF